MKRYLTILFTLLVTTIYLTAQDSTLTRDLECWYSAGGRVDFADKKIRLAVKQEFRNDRDMSRVASFFTNVDLTYKISKDFRVGGGFRLIRDRKGNDGFMTEHRFSLKTSYRHDIDRLRIQYRVMWQNKSNAEFENSAVTKYRFRTKLDYNIRKWKYDPFLSGEIYYAIEDLNFSYVDSYNTNEKVSEIQKIRLKTGTEINLKKMGGITIFYMLEHQFKEYDTNFNIPITWHIVGLNYEFKL